MKKIYFTLGIIIILALIILSLRFILGGDEDTWLCQNSQWIKHGHPSASKPTESCHGKEIVSFSECIAAGYPVLESYPRQCKTSNNKTFTENIGNELEKSNLIRVDSPRPNQTIQSPLVIKGQARGSWFFEASFPIQLIDENGEVVAQGSAQAQSDWMTDNFVPFKAELDFPFSLSGKGILILKKDNPSGLPQYDEEIKIPVIFKSTESVKVKVFFNNNKLDPEATCNKVFPVEREIPKTEGIARAALAELLKGPTQEEKNEGYFTNINQGVEIQKLTIADGVAKVDFNEVLEFQIGGSCRVTAIRTEISETLKQFPTIKEVIISIDGRTEDILQP